MQRILLKIVGVAVVTFITCANAGATENRTFDQQRRSSTQRDVATDADRDRKTKKPHAMELFLRICIATPIAGESLSDCIASLDPLP